MSKKVMTDLSSKQRRHPTMTITVIVRPYKLKIKYDHGPYRGLNAKME
jgi:hypothetical protein